jgi:hypothetical protein
MNMIQIAIPKKRLGLDINTVAGGVMQINAHNNLSFNGRLVFL